MTMKTTLFAGLALFLALASERADAAEATPLRRFAFIVAANDGGPGRALLRYAVSDAKAFAVVLEELGGVERADQLLLLEPTRAALDESLRAMSSRLQEARASAARLELVLYYSGHSNEHGLLLGKETVTYSDLRKSLESLPADVRIAILDSCASGAMTRLKGGRARPPFLADQSTEVKGYAVLTSSSEDEAAQESDRIGASFFTHFLVSGLRGAADLTSDGRVTLNEAYNFAFHETLKRTERTMSGPQHPAYDIQLAGSGDLVMTDIRATSAGLTLPEDLQGRLYLRDAGGSLVAELEKPAGRGIELGLAPGRYSVMLEQRGARREGEISLTEGTRTPLVLAALTIASPETTTVRGAEAEKTYEYVPVDLAIIPALSMSGGKETRTNFAYGLLWAGNSRVDGLSLGTVLSTIGDELVGVQIGSVAGVLTGKGSGAQIAGVANWSGDLRGAQIAGVANVADDVAGVQIGTVNVGKNVTGLQIGVVNISKTMTGPSLGLINYSTEGGMLKPTLFSSDVSLGAVGLRIGTSWMYTILAVTAGVASNTSALGYGIGLGKRFELGSGGSWYLDVDNVVWALSPDKDDLRSQDLIDSTRFIVGLRLADVLAVYAGPTFNVLVERKNRSSEQTLAPSYAWNASDRVDMWIGGTIGVDLF